MKAVTAHARVVQGPRQAQPSGHGGLGAMEGRVKTGCLGQARPQGCDPPNGVQASGLMQGRQRGQRLQRLKDLAVQ